MDQRFKQAQATLADFDDLDAEDQPEPDQQPAPDRLRRILEAVRLALTNLPPTIH